MFRSLFAAALVLCSSATLALEHKFVTDGGSGWWLSEKTAIDAAVGRCKQLLLDKCGPRGYDAPAIHKNDCTTRIEMGRKEWRCPVACEANCRRDATPKAQPNPKSVQPGGVRPIELPSARAPSKPVSSAPLPTAKNPSRASSSALLPTAKDLGKTSGSARTHLTNDKSTRSTADTARPMSKESSLERRLREQGEAKYRANAIAQREAERVRDERRAAEKRAAKRRDADRQRRARSTTVSASGTFENKWDGCLTARIACLRELEKQCRSQGMRPPTNPNVATRSDRNEGQFCTSHCSYACESD